MRAYININQKAFSELAILKRTKIDLIDATIFEYIVKFAVSNKAEKQLIDNKLFVWCSYQKIIDDNPLLNINSKKAIELRLNKLIEIGLFEKFTDKSKGNKTFFNVTDLAYSLVEIYDRKFTQTGRDFILKLFELEGTKWNTQSH